MHCLVYYKEEKYFSFFLLYLTTYLLDFYCVYFVGISPTLIAYASYLFLLFLYYCSFISTRRFTLRTY
jgi:hypothetical protein